MILLGFIDIFSDDVPMNREDNDHKDKITMGFDGADHEFFWVKQMGYSSKKYCYLGGIKWGIPWVILYW
jgi:hypothetical protein